jgi:hypothetical protein
MDGNRIESLLLLLLLSWSSEKNARRETDQVFNSLKPGRVAHIFDSLFFFLGHFFISFFPVVKKIKE